RQVVEIDLDDGEIRFRIGTDDLGERLASVGQCDFDFLGGFDHVVVGQDVALRADDDAGAEADLFFLFLVEAVAEELAEERIVQERILHGRDWLAGEDVDHRRHRQLGGFAVGRLDRRRVRRRFQHGDGGRTAHFLRGAEYAAGPFGFQGRYNEQDRQTDGYGLRKQQP